MHWGLHASSIPILGFSPSSAMLALLYRPAAHSAIPQCFNLSAWTGSLRLGLACFLSLTSPANLMRAGTAWRRISLGAEKGLGQESKKCTLVQSKHSGHHKMGETVPAAAAMEVAPGQQEESTAQQEELDLEVCHLIKGLPALSALVVVCSESPDAGVTTPCAPCQDCRDVHVPAGLCRGLQGACQAGQAAFHCRQN